MQQSLLRLSKQLDVPVALPDAKSSSSKPSTVVVGAAAAAESSASEAEAAASSPLPSSSAPSTCTLSSSRPAVISPLLGLSLPTWRASSSSSSSEDDASSALSLFDVSLNASQRSALDFALRANHFALIHGPPGTGKTATLTELILQFALAPGKGKAQRKRVLVCAASNLAVDNVLARLLQTRELREEKVAVTRVGRECCCKGATLARGAGGEGGRD
jgi:DNA polymerase alpha-associated DNA helicase A